MARESFRDQVGPSKFLQIWPSQFLGHHYKDDYQDKEIKSLESKIGPRLVNWVPNKLNNMLEFMGLNMQ